MNVPYKTSKDYHRLWRELQQETIVCFADWKPPYEPDHVCRDVCKTMWHSGTATIGCRGVTYVWAENEAEFIASCEEANIEAIFPKEMENP